jgi:hypothetical protein
MNYFQTKYLEITLENLQSPIVSSRSATSAFLLSSIPNPNYNLFLSAPYLSLSPLQQHINSDIAAPASPPPPIV